MTEHYIVTKSFGSHHDNGSYIDGVVFTSYPEAELYAKKSAAKRNDDYIILKDYATAKAVVPQIEIVKHS